jgi:hypothetical protein
MACDQTRPAAFRGPVRPKASYLGSHTGACSTPQTKNILWRTTTFNRSEPVPRRPWKRPIGNDEKQPLVLMILPSGRELLMALHGLSRAAKRLEPAGSLGNAEPDRGCNGEASRRLSISLAGRQRRLPSFNSGGEISE